jgi:hypothetical protein
MRAFKLSDGEYIDLDKIVTTIPIDSPDWPGYSLRIYFESCSTNAKAQAGAEVIAALNAPVQIETFTEADDLPGLAAYNAQLKTNQFLASIQPWQVINISLQITPESDGVFSCTITVIYRDLAKPSTEEAA